MIPVIDLNISAKLLHKHSRFQTYNIIATQYYLSPN